MNRYLQIFESWHSSDNSYNNINDILEWINELNNIVKVNINKENFNDNDFWHYDKDKDAILNNNNSFFHIDGILKEDINANVICNQPIIVQPEIGYLGIIAKEINDKLYLLMQAKIEPGNINKVQISPTLQATRSNFMRTHGGKQPKYLEYFLEKNKYEILIDQVQSEQSSRFLGKRNRNIIIVVNEEIEIDKWHKWMSIGQIKKLMKYDNLVNMDTRTVLACLPFSLRKFSIEEKVYIKKLFKNESFYNSIFNTDNCGDDINNVYHYLNDEKMFDYSKTKMVGLSKLKGWEIQKDRIFSNKFPYDVIYCNIEIEGREVRKWKQPLFRSLKPYIFGLICCNVNGKMKYLVKGIKEIGCFDKIELGPTVQIVEEKLYRSNNEIDKIFEKHLKENIDIKFMGIFSEEGGRFYHEQNKNVIIEINYIEYKNIKLPYGYFWLDYYTLNLFVQFNNCLNIQLRNLISLMEM